MSTNEQVFGAGQVLFKQGDKGGDLYFIVSGKVNLSVRDESSGAEAIVATVSDKSVIGTMSFLEGDQRSATATVAEELRCVKVTQVQRDKMLSSIPSWLKVLIKDLSSSLRRLNLQFTNVNGSIKNLEDRLRVKTKQKEQLESQIKELQEETAKDRSEWKNTEATLRQDKRAAEESLKKVQTELATLKSKGK